MFELGKIYLLLSSPPRIAFVLLCVGVVLLYTRQRRLGRRIIAGLVVSTVILSFVPVGDWLLQRLEARFPRLDPLPRQVHGIVLLGGEINQQLTLAHGLPVIGRGASRLLAFADLARRYPSARLVFSGGSGQLLDHATTEAAAMPIALRAVGIEETRVEFEGRSRNTYENAVFSKEIADPKPGETWLVITSAFHVPRTVGAFRQAGFPVQPYAVDYANAGVLEWDFDVFSFDKGFGSLSVPLKEFVGLAAYRMLGYTDALFPAP